MMIVTILSSCSKLNEEDIKVNEYSSASDIVLTINTTRNEGNILHDHSTDNISLRSITNDPFTEIRKVVSTESVILPELQQHIWIGNIVQRKSIVDCSYIPIKPTSRNPITVSLTNIQNTSSKKINNISFSEQFKYLNEQYLNASFKQNGEFSFSVEQFTSYNELKSAFGTNVNTSSLFWKNTSSEYEEDHSISKATGLYIRFYQTSFKMIMDYPETTLGNIDKNMINDAVYVSSITYGRLGILTLETNSSADYSKLVINNTFRKLFSSGNSTFTKEEQSFLDGCDFKLYLIGGNSTTAVQSFTGYSGFITHIKKGSFSSKEPGEPMFCTFSNFKDNSTVSTEFQFNIKKEPVYAEMKLIKQGIKQTDGIYLYFYKNKSRTPTIANPSIKFNVLINEANLFIPAPYAKNFNMKPFTEYEENNTYSNASSDIRMKISSRATLEYTNYVGDTPHGSACEVVNSIKMSFIGGKGYQVINQPILATSKHDDYVKRGRSGRY